MAVDKKYCMSSYMALRYIAEEDKEFFEGIYHQIWKPSLSRKPFLCHTAEDIDIAIKAQMEQWKDKKKGILLSGGMDSAIVASYLQGGEAYTFRFCKGAYQREELERAEYYAAYYGLNLHYVEIGWETVIRHIDRLMEAKGAPVHSIEPQILEAALQAKEDGVELMLIGESSDLVFGGMDQLLSKDWTVEEFMERYQFTKPEEVLEEPESMRYLFERYRKEGEQIDFLKFMDEVFAVESSNSYVNAFYTASMPYADPYAALQLAGPLDLQRVRNGEPKYLIRELMAKKYPGISIPNKIPMPRPVEEYFKEWKGPKRKEFLQGLDINRFTGNQKWQIWCLERFLNKFDPVKIMV